MKYVIVFSLFLCISFLAVLLYGKWNQTQTVQKAKKSTEVTTEKIPFAVETAPKQSLKASIVTMTGDVYWESRIATAPALLKELRMPQQGESVETAEDASITIAFPDVAEVTVLENAKLSLIQTLPSRLVFGQNAGVVLYENNISSPISVRSLALLVAQEKGAMSVTVNEEDRTVSVAVTEGTVSVAFNDLENSVSKIIVVEGQQFVFDSYSRTGEVLE